jgi:ubiquitin-like 1-activating enzyme E1 B
MAATTTIAVSKRYEAHDAVLGAQVASAIREAHVLVVGAGGIGCELLKNLVMAGFEHLEVIDMDTIDLSNLNRQFLFRKQHIGHSKCETARESALQFNPRAQITSHHGNVKLARFGPSYFKQFDMGELLSSGFL